MIHINLKSDSNVIVHYPYFTNKLCLIFVFSQTTISDISYTSLTDFLIIVLKTFVLSCEKIHDFIAIKYIYFYQISTTVSPRIREAHRILSKSLPLLQLKSQQIVNNRFKQKHNKLSDHDGINISPESACKISGT